MKERPPKRMLKEETVERLSRKAQAIGLSAEYAGRALRDLIAADEEMTLNAFGNAYHALGRAVKGMDASLEESAFAHLQTRGAKKVARQRSRVEKRGSEHIRAAERHEEEKTEWRREMEGRISILRERIAALAEHNPEGAEVAGALANISDRWETPDDLLERIDEKLWNVEYEREALSEDLDEDTSETRNRRSSIRYALEAVREDLRKLRSHARGFRRIWNGGVRRVERAQERAENARASRALPENVVEQRRRLLADRERMLSSLHAAQLGRISARRRLAELGGDMRELWQGRAPDAARAERELRGRVMLRAELENRLALAERFESPQVVRARLDGVRAVEGLGRQPTVREIEELVASASLPEELRERLDRLLPSSLAQAGRGYVLDMRYGPAKPRLLRSLLALIPAYELSRNGDGRLSGTLVEEDPGVREAAE